MEQTFEKRKKIIYDFICDDFYVPMKLKELAILLQVPKDQRNELKKVMDALVADGKVSVTQKGKYVKGTAKQLVRRMHEDLALLRSKDKPMIFLSQRTMRMGHFTWTRWKLS